MREPSNGRRKVSTMGRIRMTTTLVALGVVLAVVLGVACAATAWQWHREEVPFPGFLVYRSGAVTSLWRASWPGRQVGLRVRDVVVAVDGQPTAGGAQIVQALAQRRGAANVEITVREPPWFWPARAEAPRTLTLPLGRLAGWDLAYTLLVPFSNGLVYLLLGCVVFGLKPSPESALAAGLCLLAAAFYLTMFDSHTTYRFTRVWQLYPLFGPLSIHLFARFPEVRRGWARRRVLVPLYLTAGAVVAWRQLALDDPHASDVAALVSSIVLSCE